MKFFDKNIVKILVFISVILLFVAIAFSIYKSYKDNYDKDLEVVDNYYNFEFLFNNDYIKIANDISLLDDNDDFYMYLDGDNVLHIKHQNDGKNLNKEIFGLPKGNVKIYYNKLYGDCLEVAGLIDNELYYNNFCLLDDKVKDFEMISTIAKDIYVPSVDKRDVFVIDNDVITSNFIINTTLNEVKYISYKDGSFGLYNDINKVKPYFDYICFDENIDICSNTMVYINFNKELVFSNDLDNVIMDEDGNSLIVQDIFGTLKIDSKRSVDYNSISFNNLNKYDYLFVFYIVDTDNNLYIISMDDKNSSEKSFGNAFSYSDVKINKIKYEEDSNGKIKKVIITFLNGDINEIESDDNFNIFNSTLADRRQKLSSVSAK